MNRVFTGNYFKCKAGNLISISKDKGKDAGFVRKSNARTCSKRKLF